MQKEIVIEKGIIIKMKKIISCLLITSILLVGCGKGAEESSSQVTETKVRIGLTGSIYEEIWSPIAEELKEEGILLELVQFKVKALLVQAAPAVD